MTGKDRGRPTIRRYEATRSEREPPGKKAKRHRQGRNAVGQKNGVHLVLRFGVRVPSRASNRPARQTDRSRNGRFYVTGEGTRPSTGRLEASDGRVPAVLPVTAVDGPSRLSGQFFQPYSRFWLETRHGWGRVCPLTGRTVPYPAVKDGDPYRSTDGSRPRQTGPVAPLVTGTGGSPSAIACVHALKRDPAASRATGPLALRKHEVLIHLGSTASSHATAGTSPIRRISTHTHTPLCVRIGATASSS
ncbi:hypothetical protein C8R45DRAFT_936639 [Mycena sanguinolenta]|nr:hypothetical protein C8R45DRAFT_936639 [Mycena sanguinolenta]